MKEKRAVVAGAGPAGLSAAIGLLRSGFAVTVLEQRTRWQGRVCGAFLNPEAAHHLRWLGVLNEIQKEAVAVNTTKVTTSIGTQTWVRTAQKGQAALALPRQRLEEILMKRVQQEGGEIQMGTRFRPGEKNYNTDFVVMAGGRFCSMPNGIVPRSSPTPAKRARESETGWYGWNATFENVDQEPGDMSLHFYPGGYVGVLTFAHRQTNVCGLVQKKEGQNFSWEKIFEEAKERHVFFRRQVSQGTRTSEWQGVGPLPFSRNMRKSEGEGLLAGDAAAVGDPFMGEGNGRALGAGPMIFQAISVVPNAHAHIHDMISVYEQLWKKHYVSRLRLGFWVRRALGSPAFFPIGARLLLSNRWIIHKSTPFFHAGFQAQPLSNFCKSIA